MVTGCGHHTVHYDFRAHDPIGSVWGLPLLIPTCPRKLFAQGVRLKYVDIATDTLQASSSDLITWNTLAMIKHGFPPKRMASSNCHVDRSTASFPTSFQRKCASPTCPDELQCSSGGRLKSMFQSPQGLTKGSK